MENDLKRILLNKFLLSLNFNNLLLQSNIFANILKKFHFELLYTTLK